MGVTRTCISLQHSKQECNYRARFILFCYSAEHALSKIIYNILFYNNILHKKGSAVNDVTNLPPIPLYFTHQSKHQFVFVRLSFDTCFCQVDTDTVC